MEMDINSSGKNTFTRTLAPTVEVISPAKLFTCLIMGDISASICPVCSIIPENIMAQSIMEME